MEYINKLYVEKPFVVEENDLVPSSLIVAKTIQGQRSSQPFRALFDPGSDFTFIHERDVFPQEQHQRFQETVLVARLRVLLQLQDWYIWNS